MNRELVEIVGQYALLLERADETEIPLETAVRLQEDLAFRLQKLNPGDRTEFIRVLMEIAKEMSSAEDREILERLPDEAGILES